MNTETINTYLRLELCIVPGEFLAFKYVVLSFDDF